MNQLDTNTNTRSAAAVSTDSDATITQREIPLCEPADAPADATITISPSVADDTPTHPCSIYDDTDMSSYELIHDTESGVMFYGAKPIRELTDADKTPSAELREFSDTVGPLSFLEQTIGPGFEEIPDPEENNRLTRSLAHETRLSVDDLIRLPHPKYEWPSYLLTNTAIPSYHSMRQVNLLQQRGKFSRHDGTNSNELVIWRVHPEAYRLALERYLDRDGLPCGHSGIANYDGEWYGCADDRCAFRYRRSVVEEVFW